MHSILSMIEGSPPISAAPNQPIKPTVAQTAGPRSFRAENRPGLEHSWITEEERERLGF